MEYSVRSLDYAVYIIRLSDYRILDADEEFERMTGYSKDDYKNHILKQTDLILGSDIVEYLRVVQKNEKEERVSLLEHRLKRKDGTTLVVFCFGELYMGNDAKEPMAKISITDVSNVSNIASVRADDNSYLVMSRHDSLTGLYNRGAFEKKVAQDLYMSQSGVCSMMLVDIKNLKQINKQYGTQLGDYVLNQLAARLVAVLPSDMILSRIGGDEFCIYTPQSDNNDVQHSYMKQILAIARDITFAEYPDVKVRVSVGVAYLLRKDATFDILYGNAETALKWAKLKKEHYIELFNNTITGIDELSGSLLVVTKREKMTAHIHNAFAGRYHLLYAQTTQEAMDIIDRERESVLLLLTDIYSVDIEGFDLLDYMRKMDYISDIPVVFLSQEYIEDVYKNAFAHGVTDIVTEPIDSYSLASRLSNIIELYKHKNVLEETTIRQHEKIKKMNDNIIEYLGNVVEFRDTESGSHIKRVKAFTRIIAQYMMCAFPEYDLSQTKVDMIVAASPLHDVGKISIPDRILLKPGKLTEDEFAIMKTHTTKGYDIIMQIFDDADLEYKKYCAEIARFHHEKYDGRGYPDGLKEDEIPIGAQMVALADVYDALTSKRCYKDKFSFAKAYEMICTGACGKFNPKLLVCLDNVRAELERQALFLCDDKDL